MSFPVFRYNPSPHFNENSSSTGFVEKKNKLWPDAMNISAWGKSCCTRLYSNPQSERQLLKSPLPTGDCYVRFSFTDTIEYFFGLRQLTITSSSLGRKGASSVVNRRINGLYSVTFILSSNENVFPPFFYSFFYSQMRANRSETRR